MKKLLLLTTLLTLNSSLFTRDRELEIVWKEYNKLLKNIYLNPVRKRLSVLNEDTPKRTVKTVIGGTLFTPTFLGSFFMPVKPFVALIPFAGIPINQAMMQNFYLSTFSRRATGNIFVDGGLINTFTGDGF